MEPWHADVFEFLDLRKNTGGSPTAYPPGPALFPPAGWVMRPVISPSSPFPMGHAPYHQPLLPLPDGPRALPSAPSPPPHPSVLPPPLTIHAGKEEARARDLFYGLWINDLFMRRVEANEDWSLFCPNEAPGLAETWGENFDELYLKCVVSSTQQR